MKNAIILILSIITLSINTNNNNSEAKMLNKFKKGFYFEKYKTAEEAKEQLLKLHPIGSDVDALIKTLEGAGAKILKRDMLNYKKFYPKNYELWKSNENTESYNIFYDKASPFFIILNWIEWGGDIWINKDNKITFINLNKGRAY